MVSFWKTSGFSFVVALLHLGVSIYELYIGASDFTCMVWLLSAMVWFCVAHVEYSNARVKLLEEKVIALEDEYEERT